MPTIWEIAEALAALYWELWERRDQSLDGSLDSLFDAVADLDTLAGGISRPSVRQLLDAPAPGLQQERQV
jgi:hypothetical protein